MYSMRTRLLPFSWFSMKLGKINSFLIVCFTMVQKINKNIEFSQKYHSKSKKTIFTEKCVTLTINTREEMVQKFSHNLDRLSSL